jgi:hypothetical protein
MTLKELSQLYYLNREIELDKERLDELRMKAESTGVTLTGMPGNPNPQNKLERYVAEIVDLEAIISAKQMQCIHERNRLERYIADIPDSLTRQIFTLRFVSGLSWQNIEIHIGYTNSWKNLSNICYRYIKNQT